MGVHVIKWLSGDHRVGYHCSNKLLFATNFMYWKTKWFRTSLGCMILLITQCAINSLVSRKKYRKIPKISLGAYIFQRTFLRGLFLEGLIFGGAYLRREICVSKSIGLACSGKEIYHFCFVLLCIWGQIPSTSPPGGLYSEGRFNEGFFALRFWGAYTWRGLFSEFYGITQWKLCSSWRPILDCALLVFLAGFFQL